MAGCQEENIKVTMHDFHEALKEVQPAFGAATESLTRLRLNGIIPYGDRFTHLTSTCKTLVEQARAQWHHPTATHQPMHLPSTQ
jgi:vesicle-fusing ATPase